MLSVLRTEGGPDLKMSFLKQISRAHMAQRTRWWLGSVRKCDHGIMALSTAGSSVVLQCNGNSGAV